MAAACFCIGMANAQTTTAVSVTQQIQLYNHTNPPVTLSPGPIPSTGVRLTTGGSQLWIEPMPPIVAFGPCGWTVMADLRTVSSGPQTATASVSGRIQIVLSAPQQISGALILIPYSWNSSLSTVTGDVTVDTNCDGVPDLSARTSPHTEMPLSVGPLGTAICVDLGLSTSTNPLPGIVHGGATRQWRLVFVPHIYSVGIHAPGCGGGFGMTRSMNDLSLQISVYDANAPGPAPTITWALLMIGLAPTTITLPVSPFCVQHVQSPVLMVANGNAGPWIWSWSLPAVQLPPGLQVYAQAALSIGTSVYTTDTLRTL